MSADWKRELREAKQMFDDGILTEEQFNKIRENLVDRQMSTPPTNKDVASNLFSGNTGTMIQPPSNTNPLGRTQGTMIQQTSGTNPLGGSPLSEQGTNFYEHTELEAKSSIQSRGSTLEQGMRVGDYQIVGKLGEGGMGSVFRGRHHNEVFATQGGDVAIKVMKTEYANNPAFKNRFLREAGIGRRIFHRNIAQCLGFVDDGNHLALVMSYVEGKELKELITTDGMSVDEVIKYVRPVAEALDFLHSKSIVHRDIKPENIKINQDGEPIILDMGIAKDTSDDKDKDQTKTSTGMGTLPYMAPEQFRDAKNVTGKADQYALGIMVYEMLSGKLPWNKGTSEFDISANKAFDKLQMLEDISRFSSKISTVVHKCLESNIEKRYPTCMDFINALSDCRLENSRAEDIPDKKDLSAQEPKQDLQEFENQESSFKENTSLQQDIIGTFGDYIILEKLGEGGQGTVFKCIHKDSQKAEKQGGEVALKKILASQDEDMIRRFKNEAETGMELEHPNIVKVHEFVSEDEHFGIIMDYIQGDDLEFIIERRSTVFRWNEISDWIGCICDAMSYAHSKGIVHRDIKPENIRISPNGKLTILDFGIAKRQNDSKKTQIGIGMGTPIYMAPEQYFNATNVDGRADIYALAVMIVEMLTNRFPYNDTLSDSDIYHAKKISDLDELKEILKPFPEHFQQGLHRALQGEPQNRQESMFEFFEELYPKQKKVRKKTNKTIIIDKETFFKEQLQSPKKNLNDQKDSSQAIELPSRSNNVFPIAIVALLLLVISYLFAPSSKEKETKSEETIALKEELKKMKEDLNTQKKDAQRKEEQRKEEQRKEEQRKEEQRTKSPQEKLKSNMTWIQLYGDKSFKVGRTNGDNKEKPPHNKYVGSFKMMKTEVTVGQYRACVNDGACSRPSSSSERASNRHYCTYDKSNRNAALNCVTWYQAQDFCNWLNARLPSEAEWEYAATSGGKGYKFPWGNSLDWDCKRSVSALGRAANTGLKNEHKRACGKNRVAEPCSKKLGNSEQGICDLSGNLWEWTGDCDTQYRETCSSSKPSVSRGGGFWSNAEQIRSTRRALSSKKAQMDVGFRCVY